jgi:hypothetical protein
MSLDLPSGGGQENNSKINAIKKKYTIFLPMVFLYEIETHFCPLCQYIPAAREAMADFLAFCSSPFSTS